MVIGGSRSTSGVLSASGQGEKQKIVDLRVDNPVPDLSPDSRRSSYEELITKYTHTCKKASFPQ